MMQFDFLVEGTVTTDAESRATQSGRPFVTFSLDHQQVHRDSGATRNTVRVPFDVTCWDKRLMPSLANIRKGQRVLVHATRFKIREAFDTGEPRFDLTPDLVHTVSTSRDPHMLRCLVSGWVTATARSLKIGNDQRPMVTFGIEHQQGYYDNRNRWKDTQRVPFEVACFDEDLMPSLRGIGKGQRVLVAADRLNILSDAGGGRDLYNLTPQFVRILAEPEFSPARQRDGHTVVTPHGERIDAAAWPEVVTDLEFVHHG
ncbi:single-stranded DNA-binding protein [Actinoplanes sp. NPDC000266]